MSQLTGNNGSPLCFIVSIVRRSFAEEGVANAVPKGYLDSCRLRDLGAVQVFQVLIIGGLRGCSCQHFACIQ